MSEIPYYFETPTPKYFREKGLFKNPKNCAFITWCFEKCNLIERIISHDSQILTLKPYQFIFGRLVCSEETGLSEDEVRTQQKRWENMGFLKKAPNKTPKRFTIYEWVLTAFLKPNPQVNPRQTPNKPPSNPHKQEQKNLRPIDLKEPTPTPSAIASGSEVSIYSCLVGLVISEKEKVRLSRDFTEIEVVRAITVLKEQKKKINDPVAFIVTAISKNYKPKKTVEFQLSSRGKNNKETIIKFKNKFHNELSIKDIPIYDMIDHILFNGIKVFYESDTFGKDVYKILENTNLSHLLRNTAVPEENVITKILKEQAQKMKIN